MFEQWLEKYNIDKNYNKEARTINKDISYLMFHYERTRLNKSVDLIMIIPTIIDDKKGNIIRDMYLNATIDWWKNMEYFLPALDLIDAFIIDINTLATGTLEAIVTDFKTFNKELKTISEVELIDYIHELLPTKPTLAEQVETIWASIDYSNL